MCSKKNTIYYRDEKIVCDYPLLPSGYSAITVFGTICTPKSRTTVLKGINSPSPRHTFKITVNHEKFHIAQGRELGWIKFYLMYFWFWLCGMFKYGGGSYRNIPFEREAYVNANNLDYWTEKGPNATYWRNYKDGGSMLPGSGSLPK